MKQIENKLNNLSTEQFLNDIHGQNKIIYFQVGSKTWKNSPYTYPEVKSKLKWLNNHKKKDICFIVNTGGTRNSQISKINAVFADWDCGKDNQGN